jgi:hypothetical protein
MSQIHLYIDEDSQDQSLLRALRARQIDVLAVRDTDTYSHWEDSQMETQAIE